MNAQSVSRPSTSIELAPHHKQGIQLPNPVLLAAGVVGYGDALAPGLELASLGGYVTAPVTRRPWRNNPPQLVEIPGGLLWQRGLWNPGLRRVVRDYAPSWRHSVVPVIVHLADSDPNALATSANSLEELPGVAGVEIDIPIGPGAVDEGSTRVWAVREACDLPLLVRLAIDASDNTVQSVLDAGADTLVMGQPPATAYFDPSSSTLLRGSFHGPAVVGWITARLVDLVPWATRPVIACGGIHRLEDAIAYLGAGAVAVQIDTAAWVDPGLPGRIAAALAGQGIG